MKNIRDMPYIRQLADRMVETRAVDTRDLDDAFALLDMMDTLSVIDLWNLIMDEEW